MLCPYRLPHSNYLHRMPRTPYYQTTPFTIDPSARSTQTFAERYGVSPPQSNENLYGNDYTIIGAHDEKLPMRNETLPANHKADLSKASSSPNVIQQANNNNNSNADEPEHSSKASKSTVIKRLTGAPNNTCSTNFDVEQRLQVSFRHPILQSRFFPLQRGPLFAFSLIVYVKQFFEPFMHTETCRYVEACGKLHQQSVLGLIQFRGNGISCHT